MKRFTENDAEMQARIDAILFRLSSACERAGRAVDDVRLIAVSKTYSPDAVHAAAKCGLSAFGESRVYEAEAKIPLCPGHIQWEFIGHLQRNKVRRAVALFSMMHAVDSLPLLNKINSCAELQGSTVSVCLEVNVSGEASKYGFAPDTIPSVLDAAADLLHIDVVGVMTIPPFTGDAEHARPYFRKLRELRDGWSERSGFALQELSMGMSGDFEVAVEEGATCVRVGTAIFGSRD